MRLRAHPPTIVGDLYLQFRVLPDSCRPCWLYREDGATLIAIDPRTTKAEAIVWCVDNLTTAELNAYRAAYGLPCVGVPLPEGVMVDEPVDCYIPPALRLRNAAVPALYLAVAPVWGSPARVVRSPRGTSVIIDPNATNADVLQWGRANLSLEERNRFRAAIGAPPVGIGETPGLLARLWRETFEIPTAMRVPAEELLQELA